MPKLRHGVQSGLAFYLRGSPLPRPKEMLFGMSAEKSKPRPGEHLTKYGGCAADTERVEVAQNRFIPVTSGIEIVGSGR